MLRLAMLSLICSVTSGVFGFGGSASPPWPWGQILFPVFFVFATIAFLGGLLVQPVALQEVRIDDRLPDERPAEDSRQGTRGNFS
ncbi:MAG TPA: hypothetical protein VL475_06990 [Planctomycetaceae bacterium]|nr:hypothetical protein [Planctomycetaceae bacterium]